MNMPPGSHKSSTLGNRAQPAKAIAVIIARAGSKGLPGKNALTLAGRPIVSYSIDHARAADRVGRILVSSDCPTVIAAAQTERVETILRPAELADDVATVDAAVRHAVADDPSSCVVILYGNVPVRPPGLIDCALAVLAESGADSVQSYAPVGKYHPFWLVKLDENGAVQQFIANQVYRRQDLPPLYVPDGGVIAVSRKALFTVAEGDPHAFLGSDRRGIVNEAGAVMDIDGPADLALAESALAARRPDPPLESMVH